MTIKELKTKLDEYPDDTIVAMWKYDYDTIEEVKEVNKVQNDEMTLVDSSIKGKKIVYFDL